MPIWGSGRSKLINATLFGFAPLALVGIVAAAFVLSSSGKGEAASHTGFQAGAAVSAGSQPQRVASTASSAPTPSGSKGKSKHPGQRSSTPQVTASAKSGTGAKSGQKSKPKPSHKPKSTPSSGRVTPANLGLPNFDGYCHRIGQGTAVTTANNAYGWHCSANPALTISVQGACASTYGLSASKVIGVSTNYYSANAWQCWRTNGILGQLSFTAYCPAAGLGTAKLAASNAYGWSCTGAPTVDPMAACQFVYHRSTAFARFAVFADPYSWQCWD